MTWGERALFWLADALTALYAFAVGATLGSFVNVVVYRLPRGMSLARPGSRCPACGTPIRLRDNLPVIGWLRLTGRCRACGGEVSARYPLVEAAYGLLFATLLFVDVAWQPGFGALGRGSYRGVLLTLWSLNAEQLSLYAWHAWLFSLLGIVALLELDGQRIPRRIVGGLLCVGLFAPLCLPRTRDVHWHDGIVANQVPAIGSPAADGLLGTGPALTVWLDGLAGLAAGGAMGLALCGAMQRGRANLRGALAIAASALGLYYGWQAACGIWGVAAVSFLGCALQRRGGPLLRWPTFVLTASGLATAWARPWLSEAAWWPGPVGSLWAAALWASGAAIGTLACGCVVRIWPPRGASNETLGWRPVRERLSEEPSVLLEPTEAQLGLAPAAPDAALPPSADAPPAAESL